MGGGMSGQNQNYNNHHSNHQGNLRPQYNNAANAPSTLQQQPRKTPSRTPDFVNNLNDILEHQSLFSTNYNEDDMHHILGSHIFKKIDTLSLIPSAHIPKITGMLIDKDVFSVPEIIDLLKDDQALVERVNEAIELINSQNKE